MKEFYDSEPAFVIRKRRFSEVFDLAFRIFCRQWKPITGFYLILVVPLFFLNGFLLTSMLKTGFFGISETLSLNMQVHQWRFAGVFLCLMFVLIKLEAGIAESLVVAYLGQWVFQGTNEEKKMQPRRLDDPLWQETFFDVSRNDRDLVSEDGRLSNVFRLWWSRFPSLCYYLIVFRLFFLYIYITPILLLEDLPFSKRGQTGFSFYQRCRYFHHHNGGNFIWFLVNGVGTGAAMLFCLWFFQAWQKELALQDDFLRNFLVFVVFPAVMWGYQLMISCVRFFNYLNLRIDQEGWDLKIFFRKMLDRISSGKTFFVGLFFCLVSSLTALPVHGITADDFQNAEAEQLQNAEATRETNAVGDRVDRILANEPFPWYSLETGEPVFLPPLEKEVTSESPTRTSRSSAGGEATFQIFGRVLSFLALGTLLTLTLWILIRFSGMARKKKRRLLLQTKNQQRRLDTLAPEAKQMFSDLDQATRDAWKRDDFRAAIIYYFSDLLVELDQKEILWLHQSKTNHDYVMELAPFPEIQTLFQRVTSVFEKTYYGNFPLSRQEFESVWSLRDAFVAFLQTKTPRESVDWADGQRTPHSWDFSKLGLWGGFWIGLSGLLWSAGCRHEPHWSEKYTEYGVTHQFSGVQSMNGCSLLIELCQARGHQVQCLSQLPISLEKYDSLFWFYRSDSTWGNVANGGLGIEEKGFKKFDSETKSLISQWASAKKGRTVVFVDDNYRAEYDYWKAVAPKAPAKYRNWVNQRLQASEWNVSPSAVFIDVLSHRPDDLAKNDDLTKSDDLDDKDASEKRIDSENKVDLKNKVDFRGNVDFVEAAASADEIDWEENDDSSVEMLPKEANVVALTKEDWFVFRDFDAARKTEGIQGASSWEDALPENYSWTFFRELIPNDETEVLLEADHLPILCRKTIDQSQVCILQSAQFLLNYSLLNPDNRKLAEHLIDQLGESPKNIIFITSNQLQPLEESGSTRAFSFSIMKLTPYSVVVWQLILLIMGIMFWKLPIWGRPKSMRKTDLTHFGVHVEAYADLLKNARDSKWVENQIARFEEQKPASH